MFFLQNFRERKADSDQNVLREESVFLRYFEESGRKLKKKIKIFFLVEGLPLLAPPLAPSTQNYKKSKISEKTYFERETCILIC